MKEEKNPEKNTQKTVYVFSGGDPVKVMLSRHRTLMIRFRLEKGFGRFHRNKKPTYALTRRVLEAFCSSTRKANTIIFNNVHTTDGACQFFN